MEASASSAIMNGPPGPFLRRLRIIGFLAKVITITSGNIGRGPCSQCYRKAVPPAILLSAIKALAPDSSSPGNVRWLSCGHRSVTATVWRKPIVVLGRKFMAEAHSRRTLFGIAAGGSISALLAGCAAPDRGTAVPANLTTKATVLGLPNERFFPFFGSEPLFHEVVAAIRRRQRVLGLPDDQLPPSMDILAVSGGGENGAFGAGVLCGWTEAGNRPTFELVTGVSTGALTAPFAFLGSAYDEQLRAVYADIKPS